MNRKRIITIVRTIAVVAVCLFSLSLFACSRDEGPMEKAGKKADQTMEKAAEKTGDAMQKADETAEEAGKKMDETMEK